MRQLLILFCGVLFCAGGCKQHEDTSVGPGDVGVFDLSLGKSWTYKWSMNTTDSSGNVLNNVTDTIQVQIAAIGDSLDSYKGLIRFEARSIVRYIGTSKVWYRAGGDSLVEIAYSNAGSVPVVLPKLGVLTIQDPKNSTLSFSLFPSLIQKLMKSGGVRDSAVFRQDIRIVYKFPLVAGKTWTSFTSPFFQTREVIGSETIERAGKMFVCAKINTRLPLLSPNIEWFDYVAQEGLVERRIKYDSLALTASNSPEIVSYGHADESLELMQ